jgi:hypothetical protein
MPEPSARASMLMIAMLDGKLVVMTVPPYAADPKPAALSALTKRIAILIAPIRETTGSFTSTFMH